MSYTDSRDKVSIFIIGVGRSGTSLLQSMLNAHWGVCFLPETQFLRKYLFRQRRRRMIEASDEEYFTRVLLGDPEFQRLHIRPGEAIAGDDRLSVFSVYQNITSIFLKRKEKHLVGDKDPRNIDFIREIHRYFPQASILHIIRDPRDVILSRTKADWSKHWPFWLHPCLYNAQMTRGRKVGFRQFGKQYFELYYEDLISVPEQTLKEISRFLDLEYDPSMLKYQTSAKELVSEREMQWKKETLGPLLLKNKEKWKSVFSNYQITLIERICAPAMRQLPYKLHSDWRSLSLWERVMIQMAVGVSKVFSLVYPLRVKWL